MTKFKMNDLVYVLKGTTVIKGIIDEVIEHHTQSKEIVKYLIRPYGMKQFVAFDETEVIETFEEAKSKAIDIVETTYQKTITDLKELTEEVFDSLENLTKDQTGEK